MIQLRVIADMILGRDLDQLLGSLDGSETINCTRGNTTLSFSNSNPPARVRDG